MSNTVHSRRLILRPVQFAHGESSPYQQVRRIVRRGGNVIGAKAQLLQAGESLDHTCRRVGYDPHCFVARPGDLLVVFAVEAEQLHLDIQVVPWLLFEQWGRDGLEEMQGQPAEPDWLQFAATATHDGLDGLVCRVNDALARGGFERRLADLMNDVAYGAAQRGLLSRIKAIVANGETPAIVLGVQDYRRLPAMPRMCAETAANLILLSLSPPLPNELVRKGVLVEPTVVKAAAMQAAEVWTDYVERSA